MDGFWIWEKKGEQTLSVPQMWRIWGKSLALKPNRPPRKGGEKVLERFYMQKIKLILILY